MNKADKKYRYPGAQPFTLEQQNIFFGRTEDTERLFDLLMSENFVVLYSKSGLGKSSIINAGIIPKIQKLNDSSTLSIRFGSFLEQQNKNPLNTTYQNIYKGKSGVFYLDKLIKDDKSLWYYLKKRQSEHTSNNDKFLLIFDQFEELFTYPPEEIFNFKKELKEILNIQIPQRYREALESQFSINNLKLNDNEIEELHKKIEIKILIAIRSDRLSLLNELNDNIPNILRFCYELKPLNISQAKDAILNPARQSENKFLSPNFIYELKALNHILFFLTKKNTQGIESFQLQIICHHIEKVVIEDKRITVITLEHLGNIEDIYKNYYDNLLNDIESVEERIAARMLIEDGLIFEEEERRLSLYEGQILKDFSVNPILLQKLVDNHLLRAEPSMLGGYTYELCHDSLVIPVLDSKRKRIADELRINREKEISRIANEKLELENRKREKLSKKRAIVLSIIAFTF
ncbi:MAG TPA: hypothetical protein VK590_09130, partial [Saprospiraceae bacterium]|nr:hypothetical protein [Saprospiraceae bacterium]